MGLLVVAALTVGAQPRDLEAKRKQLERDIAYTRALIAKAQQGKEQTLAEYRHLNRQLALQQELLASLDQEVGALEQDLVRLQGITGVMAADVKKLQDSYARLAYQAYVHDRSSATVLWVLSAESFQQAYNRLRYARQLSRQRGEQIRLIRRAQGRLLAQQTAIDSTLRQKQALLGQKRAESDRLAENRRRQQGLYQQLKQRERNYSQKLQQYEAALKAVKKEIDAAVRADVNRSSGVSAERKRSLVRISGQFERSRGKLPWPMPVTLGVVTGRFGRVKDASGGVVDNDGIYITTEPEQPVRAVYGGTVTYVGTYPGLGQVVMIQHGDYRTVYVNLKDLKVARGEQVFPLQQLGTVRMNGTGTAELYFLLFHKLKAINPIPWLGATR